MKKYLKLLFILLLINTSSLFSQLNIEFRYLGDETGFVDATELPLMKAEIRTYFNGNYIELPKENLYIFEGVQVVQPNSSIKIGSTDWYQITWLSEKNDFSNGYNCSVLADYQNQFAQTVIYAILNRIPNLNVLNQKGEQIQDIDFGNIPTNFDYPFGIKINGYVTLDNREVNLFIDSVTTQTKYFRVEYQGVFGGYDPVPPPKELARGFNYGFAIWCNVPDDNYYRDIVTIYYEGGLKRQIPVWCNKVKIEGKPLLQLIEPNGNQIFAPCQQVKIKWTGSSPNLPTDILYSIDNGKNWAPIASVIDSVYIWKVPSIISNKVLVKVSQKFDKTSEERIAEDSAPIYSVGFNSNSGSLLTVNEDGKILEFNIFTSGKPNIINRYYINGIPDGSVKYTSFGVEYINNDKNFLVGYRDKSIQNKDYLAFYDLGNQDPILKVALDFNFLTKRLSVDSKRKNIAFVPFLSNSVQIMQLTGKTSYTFKEVKFNSPVTDFKYNSELDEAVVSLMNGDILVLNTNDFSTKLKLSFPALPYIIEVAPSPNGRYIALGTQKYSRQDGIKMGQNTQNFVLDLKDSSIIKNYRPSPGSPIGLAFNPASTTLVIGSETDYKVSLYDLTETRTPSYLSGHTNVMTDMKISPAGTAIVTTSTSFDNIIYRTFTYPETDISDATMAIQQSDLNVSLQTVVDTYLGSNSLKNIKDIHNLGISLIDIHNAQFQNGTHFKLSKAWQRDTIYSNEYLNFDVVFQPLDTGKIRDTLLLFVCNTTFKIPFEAYSIPRKITFLNPGFDFGNVCIGDTLVKEFELFRNDDPIDLKFNFIKLESKETQGFRDFSKKDTILKPGEIFKAKIQFVPNKLGSHESDVVLYYLDQTKITNKTTVKGNGIGSFVELSHDKLFFLPENPVRELKIKNIGKEPLTYLSIITVPNNIYEVLTPTPLIILPGEEKSISIKWNGINKTTCSLVFDTEPCVVRKSLELLPFSGTSTLKIENVEADPRNSATVSISFNNKSNGAYKGVRTIEGEFEMNMRYFLPQTIQSDFGTCTLTRNQVIGTQRFIGFRVEGDFPESGILCNINGLAGLGEEFETTMNFNSSSLFWSKNISTKTESGIFKLINVVKDRIIVFPDSPIIINSISPNPADEFITIKFDSKISGNVRFEIIDYLGNRIMDSSNYPVSYGENILQLDISSLAVGTYILNIYSGNSVVSETFIISK